MFVVSYVFEFVDGCVAGIAIHEFVDVCSDFSLLVLCHEEHVSKIIMIISSNLFFFEEGNVLGLEWEKKIGQPCIYYILLDTVNEPRWANDALLSIFLQ